jgi:hypothetical protein
MARFLPSPYLIEKCTHSVQSENKVSLAKPRPPLPASRLPIGQKIRREIIHRPGPVFGSTELVRGAH